MPVTINARATWADHVFMDLGTLRATQRPNNYYVDLARRAPVPGSPWDPWKGGVFIHHRGGANPFISLDTEDDCKNDVARVFAECLKYDNPEQYTDINYNFLICPHGHIYEGRGYERGEANHAGYIDAAPWGQVGRNAGFYSICGLLRSNEMPTEAMLRSFRDLIGHLRDELAGDREAGQMILPHSFGFGTECPGNLSVYAQPGSSIDPSVPWSGSLKMDTNVFAAQKWVNATYKDAPGYVPCTANGRPGWETVDCLTQALQHELGISPTVKSFGPGTFEAVRRRNRMPAQETNPKIIALYNYALWCKGYWASKEKYIWEDPAQSSLQKLIADMGLTAGPGGALGATLWAHVTKALFRMDQFSLVQLGDINIQAVQKWLNSRYVAELAIPAMGLVPCDGIYSRDVQKGLMMGVQYELGLSPDTISGYFGPATQAGLKGKGSAPLTGHLRRLFRAACYVNSPTFVPGSTREIPLMYNRDDINTDAVTATHTQWVQAFQAFSQIPVTGTNDYTTWAQLLVSSGDTSRNATGCDCIAEITPARAQVLKDNGYRIVGRYLDEHLAPSDPYYLGKALKPGELQTILAAGLRMYPIFQYNGTQLANFTHDKGYDQGKAAHAKATGFGLPAGTCVYFAVDYDAMDSEIDSNILPYFTGVAKALAEYGGRYTYGVYGSRNVCDRVSREAGARWSFVSGMSWGFSGNLGYPLPANWSFNQIREYEIQPQWGLDHNIWRDNGDPGVTAVTSTAKGQ